MRLGVLIAAVLIALIALPAAAEARGCAGSRQLPTLKSYPPGSLTVEPTDVSGTERYHLTFGTSVGNVGRGPLTMIARRPSRSTDVLQTVQRIRCSRHGAVDRGHVGQMRYFNIRTHHHWHLRDLERYRLIRVGRSAAYDAEKQGFCLGDSYGLKQGVPNTPRSAQFSGDLSSACGRGRPRAKRVRLGLSVGWGDSYPPIIEGQFVDVTGVPSGIYRLLMEVDPHERLIMGTRRHSTAGFDFVIGYPNGQRGGPAIVEFLGECYNRSSCASEQPVSEPTSGAAALGRASTVGSALAS